MRTLILMRHSKAVTATGSGDHERPLKAHRGPEDAAAAGRALAGIGAPDFALVSDAVRTTQTFLALARELPHPVDYKLDPRLYAASAETILDLVRAVPDGVRRLLVVGHNPGIGILARQLAGSGPAEAIDGLGAHFPTSAFVDLAFPVEHWADVAPGGGTLGRFFTVER